MSRNPKTLFELSTTSLYAYNPEDYIYYSQGYDSPPHFMLNIMSARITKMFRQELYAHCADLLNNPDKYTKKEIVRCILHFCRYFDYEGGYENNKFYKETLGSNFKPIETIHGYDIEVSAQKKDRDNYYNQFKRLIEGKNRTELIKLIHKVYSAHSDENYNEYPQHLSLSYYTDPYKETGGYIQHYPASSGSGYDTDEYAELFADEELD